MRFLLFVGLLALTVLLFAHGLFFAEDARKAYDEASLSASPDYATLIAKYPYSEATRDARLATIERRAAHESQGALPGGDKLKDLLDTLLAKSREGVGDSPPYVMPFTAAVVGLAALLLALILPGTRFRGFALLGVLFGAAAALPGLLPPDDQVALAVKFPFAKTLVAEFPRVALAACLLGSLALAGRVKRRPKDDEGD
jgi:hypothetical protein